MKFTFIANPPAFFECIASCRGEVRCVDKNGAEMDLKRLAAGMEAYSFLFEGCRMNDLEVRASDPEDCTRLMRHAMEMCRA